MEKNTSTARAFGIINEDEEVFQPFWGTDSFYISKNLALQKVFEKDGHVSLHLIINDNTGIDEIERSWHKVKENRKKIQNETGWSYDDYTIEILRTRKNHDYLYFDKVTDILYPGISELKRKKPSYTDLVMDANFDALIFIECLSRTHPDTDIHKLVEHLLKSLLLKFSVSEVDDIISDALLEINDCRCPWRINIEPISLVKMREKIRYYEEKSQNGRRLFENHSENMSMKELYKLFIINNDWDNAKKRFAKTFPKLYAKYKYRLDARIHLILQP